MLELMKNLGIILKGKERKDDLKRLEDLFSFVFLGIDYKLCF